MAFLDTLLWGNTYQQYLILVACIILGIAGGKLFYWVTAKFIKLFTAKTKTKLDDLLIQVFEKPVIFILLLAGLYYGIYQLNLPPHIDAFFSKFFMIAYALNASWILINFLDAIITNYVQPRAEKGKSSLDNRMLPMVRKMVKAVVWVIVIIMLINNFGFDVSALLTGVGLGGLAFALAAQDLLSNFFGGLAILTDKPFKIGDRIRVGQNDGWVKEIGFRTTRIETLDGTQLVIPNAEIAKTTLENVSKEKARKIRITLGLEYGTPHKKMLEAEKILKDVIKKNKHTDDDSIVSFKDFGDFSLNILLIYWIKDIKKVLEVQHHINLEIKRRFELAGISIAFPTRTVHLVNEKKKRK